MVKVYGVGVNDSTEPVRVKIGKSSKLCPFYRKWSDMIRRCYRRVDGDRNESYEDCVVCDEWLVFSKFREWMISQDWEGKQLDKDLLIPGSKVYSPETCVFIDAYTNSFLSNRARDRSHVGYIGVSTRKDSDKYFASVLEMGKPRYLGYYDTPEAAHIAWFKAKRAIAVSVAKRQTDVRVSKAILARFDKVPTEEELKEIYDGHPANIKD